MNLFLRLLRDEAGLVLPAEAIVLGTVGVVGAAAGLTAVARSMDDELAESAFAIRSIDQSFQIEGDWRCGACIAGSKFTQQPVEESIKKLREQFESDKAREEKKLKESEQKQAAQSADKKDEPEPPKAKKGKKHKPNKKPKNQEKDIEFNTEEEHSAGDPLSI